MMYRFLSAGRLASTAGVALIGLLALTTGCGNSKEAELPVNSKDTLSAYRVDTVRLQGFEDNLRFTGKVSYDQRRVDRVFPVVSGNVLDVRATLGNPVQRGQTLATVQSADVSGFLNDYNAARSDYALAVRTAGNTEQLYKTNFASQSDLIAARENLAKAKSNLARTEQIVKLYGANTGGGAQPIYTVKSPVSGFVVERNVNPGMQLRPDNNTPLFTISDLSRVWILLNVYETDIAVLKVGLPVRITALAYPDREFQGTITNISNVVDPDTRVVQARVELPNPGGLLKPDMFCNVQLDQKQSLGPKNLAVSSKAIIFSDDNYYVVRQLSGSGSSGKYEVVPIKVLHSTPSTAFVKGNLKPGEKVVTEGSLMLYSDLSD